MRPSRPVPGSRISTGWRCPPSSRSGSPPCPRRRRSSAHGRRATGATVLLTGDIDTMAALHQAAPGVVRRINLGGIHHRPGRRERLPYLYLTDEELRTLVGLEAAGAEVTRAGPAHLAGRGAPDARVTALEPHVLLLLVLWGTIVALDLVSVPQAMLSRPLVAGAVAGWLAGDVEAGLRVGVVLELFALDVLPIGAVRYPDYGPGHRRRPRRWRRVRRGSWASASASDSACWWRWRAAGACRRSGAGMPERSSGAPPPWRPGRAARSAGSSTPGWRATRCVAPCSRPSGCSRPGRSHAGSSPDRQTAVGLTLVAIGSGLSAAAAGAVRSAGRGERLKWLAAGAAAGTLLAVLR